MNKEHLRLLHHFEAFTSKTFIMEPETWKHAVIKLALQVWLTPFYSFHPHFI
jgi:hypothetical protein